MWTSSCVKLKDCEPTCGILMMRLRVIIKEGSGGSGSLIYSGPQLGFYNNCNDQWSAVTDYSSPVLKVLRTAYCKPDPDSENTEQLQQEWSFEVISSSEHCLVDLVFLFCLPGCKILFHRQGCNMVRFNLFYVGVTVYIPIIVAVYLRYVLETEDERNNRWTS